MNLVNNKFKVDGLRFEQTYRSIDEKVSKIFNLLKIDYNVKTRFISLDPETKVVGLFSSDSVEELERHNQVFRIAEAYKNINKSLGMGKCYSFALETLLKKTLRINRSSFLSNPFVLSGKYYYLELTMDSIGYNSHFNAELRINYIDNILKRVYRDFFNEQRRVSGEDDIYRLEAEELVEFITKDYFRDLKLNPSVEYQNILGIINKISNMKYEKGEAFGEIVIGRLNSVVINNLIKFEESYPIIEFRKIRKLLEGTKGGYSLYTDLNDVYGFIGKKLSSTLDDIFRVKIIASYHWEVYYKGERVLKIVEGMPHFDNLSSEKTAFLKKVNEVFPTLINWEKQSLWTLVEGAIRGSKGALLVISDGYLEEGKRLAIHAMNFQPFEMNPELMENFSSIDGAIMLSPNRICSSIGVILDGLISGGGDSSRGARYNSAIKYYETMKSKYKMMLIIISEDGSIDILGSRT